MHIVSTVCLGSRFGVSDNSLFVEGKQLLQWNTLTSMLVMVCMRLNGYSVSLSSAITAVICVAYKTFIVKKYRIFPLLSYFCKYCSLYEWLETEYIYKLMCELKSTLFRTETDW
jgi:hypothetical protein